MTERPTADALVLVSYGSHGVVLMDGGQRRHCKYRRQVGRPVCGDRVTVSTAADDALVAERLLPRRNEFARADERQRKHVVAANLDQVLIVIARKPLPSRDLLERYLLATHSLGIEPVIVMNKAELQPEYDSTSAGARVLEHLPHYRALGYRVVETSCKAAPGIHALAEELHNRTSILVGQSGVGKSSLINRLLPDMNVQIGALSAATGKGTHTTTTTTLYEYPGGGFLIDSPGVWEYGIWSLRQTELETGFVEFRPLLGHCRFNNCVHHSEPGCAIKAAVQAGQIADWRYRAYLRLREQNT
ncbi:MAG: ribosome small subunit-dependent GTPase A [Lysobacterales bacterium]